MSPVSLAHAVGTAYLRTYHRHTITVDAPLPDEPSLIVGNHGFGGVIDLNVFAAQRVLLEHTDRPAIFLTHQMAWTLGAGPLVEAFGSRPARADSVAAAFADGFHVVVFPGGDLDATKSFWHRNEVSFGGRVGFARLALEHGVPIVPVVTAGAGETLVSLPGGQRIAAALRLPQLLRAKSVPVSIAAPYGPNIGLAGLLPYLPLPAKLTSAALAPMTPDPTESPTDLAARVESAMQTRLDDLVSGRRLVLG